MSNNNKNTDHQTINSLNHFDADAETIKRSKNYKEKYNLDPSLTNKYCSWVSNPTVQPDNTTEMGVPIPDEINTEFSKEYEEENKL